MDTFPFILYFRSNIPKPLLTVSFAWHLYWCSVFALIPCFLHTMLYLYSIFHVATALMYSAKFWVTKNYFSLVIMDNCSLWTKKLLHCSRKVTCQSCALSFHMNCITLSQDHRKYIEDNIDIWYCSSCTSCIFPFNNIEEDIHFMAAIKEMSANCEMSLCYLSD